MLTCRIHLKIEVNESLPQHGTDDFPQKNALNKQNRFEFGVKVLAVVRNIAKDIVKQRDCFKGADDRVTDITHRP